VRLVVQQRLVVRLVVRRRVRVVTALG